MVKLDPEELRGYIERAGVEYSVFVESGTYQVWSQLPALY